MDTSLSKTAYHFPTDGRPDAETPCGNNFTITSRSLEKPQTHPMNRTPAKRQNLQGDRNFDRKYPSLKYPSKAHISYSLTE
jgi:hypothetical protein